MKLKSPPPLRPQISRRSQSRRPKDISFSDALFKLKRGFRIRRSQWSNFYLEIKEDTKGNKEIFNTTPSTNNSIRHTFDQQEILANDWLVL